MSERTPETQPDGSLVPPPRVPPTALATMTPEPPRPDRDDLAVTRRRSAVLLAGVLDQLDRLGDRIAGAVGLR